MFEGGEAAYRIKTETRAPNLAFEQNECTNSLRPFLRNDTCRSRSDTLDYSIAAASSRSNARRAGSVPGRFSQLVSSLNFVN